MKLLLQEVSASAKNESGSTPLHEAAAAVIRLKMLSNPRKSSATRRPLLGMSRFARPFWPTVLRLFHCCCVHFHKPKQPRCEFLVVGALASFKQTQVLTVARICKAASEPCSNIALRQAWR